LEAIECRQLSWVKWAQMDLRYRVLRLTAVVARFLPMRLGYFLAECGGDALFLLAASRRNIVGDNMKRVLGVELDRRRLRQKVRGVFKNMAKNYFDLTKLSQLRLDNLERSVTIEGWHHLIKAVTSPRGTIIVTSHIGNFEVAAKVLAVRGIKMTILVEAFDSTPFLRNIAKLRQGNGCDILPVGMRAIRESLQILRRGGTLTIVCDRNIQGDGLKVKFFGEETSLPFGAVSLALRTGAAIVPLFSVRKPNNRFVIYIEPPLRLIDTGNHSQSVKANLERLVAVMERYIRQYPEQWVALEPIWRNKVAESHSTRNVD
jgi:lauroyl/myristoyl acyltransferase